MQSLRIYTLPNRTNIPVNVTYSIKWVLFQFVGGLNNCFGKIQTELDIIGPNLYHNNSIMIFNKKRFFI